MGRALLTFCILLEDSPLYAALLLFLFSSSYVLVPFFSFLSLEEFKLIILVLIRL